MFGALVFDHELCAKHYDGNAVVLRADTTVTLLPVNESGHVHLNGKDLFDPTQPFWNGKAPDVKWPERTSL